MRISKKRCDRTCQDYEDMWNAHKTQFYRCRCGRLRETGIICPNDKCMEDYK
jgi:hypothetical protein